MDTNTSTVNHEEELHVAEIQRSMDVVTKVWESDKFLSVDDMCDHMEAIIDVIAKESDFNQFAESVNLTGLERLN